MAEANVVLAVAALLLLAGLVRQYRARVVDYPCAFLWGVFLLTLFVLVPLASNLVYGSARSLHWWKQEWIRSFDTYLIYATSVLLLSAAYVAASLRWTGRGRRRREQGVSEEIEDTSSPGRRRQVGRLLLSGAATVAGVALYIYGTGLTLTQLLEGGRFLYYEQETVTGPALGLGLYMIGLIAYYAYLDAKLGFPHKAASVLIYGAVLLMVVLSGGRKWLLFLGSGMVAGIYDRGGEELRVNLTGLAGVAGLVSLVVVWQGIRAVGVLQLTPEEIVGVLMSDRLTAMIWEGDATHFYRGSLEAIRANLERGVVYPFALIRRLVLLPFPNEWTMGLKPEGIPFLFADFLRNRTPARGGNVPPGLVGSFVLSFGWKGALAVGPMVTAGMLKGADWVVRRHSGWVRDVLFANFAAAALLLMRGAEGAIYFLVFSVLAVGCIELVLAGWAKLGSARRIANRSSRSEAI